MARDAYASECTVGCPPRQVRPDTPRSALLAWLARCTSNSRVVVGESMLLVCMKHGHTFVHVDRMDLTKIVPLSWPTREQFPNGLAVIVMVSCILLESYAYS